ncbi:uncharacterized protein FOMMEDRAFT_140939 [Fomitiporia mediterranea MF3/22]|uniref:uncharacterized protein n=1 Tax=Fomitiporia mediterranea (strain MF3/22) TaxID=694068 RepID=UPI0004407B11|nr:uncharacterized protein FOMMEDRAFT_140939 [Fomitiporia mediterranea MF3/22]EJD03259.1 hypothetical protein FOMMEDRAFT_140939 [Fomitiporia mediterranea MF3/22]
MDTERIAVGLLHSLHCARAFSQRFDLQCEQSSYHGIRSTLRLLQRRINHLV